jgi:hypothetical protein
MWESSMLLPISKSKIYLGKVLVGMFFIFAYCLFSYLFYIGSIFIGMALYPENLALSLKQNSLIIIFHIRLLLALVLYGSIVIPIFIYIESAITAIGLILFFIFLGMFLSQKSWFMYYPFSYHITVLNTSKPDYNIIKDKAALVVAVYSLIALIAGTFLFKYLNHRRMGN